MSVILFGIICAIYFYLCENKIAMPSWIHYGMIGIAFLSGVAL